VTIEVQCSSCHTRYRIDEQVLPEGTPTFKCSRCGHVFTIDPRSRAQGSTEAVAPSAEAAPASPRTPRSRREPRQPISRQAFDDTPGEKPAESSPPKVADSGIAEREESAAPRNDAAAVNEALAAPSPTLPPVSSPEEKKPSTDDLLSKPFRDEETSASGENLHFDFNEDHPDSRLNERTDLQPANDRRRDEWQVGDVDFGTPAPTASFDDQPPVEEDLAPITPDRSLAASRRPRVGALKPASRKPREDFLDESAAPIYNRSAVTHSARFFVALFALVAFGYAATTVLIRSAPATAAELLSHLPKVGDRFILPVAPARLVAMRDVHSDYLQIKDGHTALVVTGIAENVGNHALHAVRIAASLHDAAQHTLASRMVYCGNNLSAPTVAQMTPHELDFYQQLDPPKAFTLEPASTSPFVIVFIDPPSAVSRFDVSVATAAALAPLPSANGG